MSDEKFIPIIKKLIEGKPSIADKVSLYYTINEYSICISDRGTNLGQHPGMRVFHLIIMGSKGNKEKTAKIVLPEEDKLTLQVLDLINNREEIEKEYVYDVLSKELNIKGK